MTSPNATYKYLPLGTRHPVELVFLFDDLHDWQMLAAAAPEGAEVVVLDGWQDGLSQMAVYLQGRSGVDALHVLSHGSQGSLHWGTTVLDAGNAPVHADLLRSMGAALADDGDVLLYGCHSGAGAAGAALLRTLSDLFGASVAASTNLTGAAALGGDWVLGRQHGAIHTPAMEGPASYNGLLAAPVSENFNGVAVNGGTGQSQGTTGVARPINGWTFTLLNSAGTQDAGGYVDVTQLSTDTSMADGGSDHAAVMNGTYVAASSGTQAAGVLKATTGEEFSFVSITVENGGGANTYRLVGYLNGSAVSGATQNFTAPAFGSNTTVSVSGSQWQYVDEVRIVQQNGAADISIYIDDIVVAAAVPPNTPPVNTASGGTTAFTEGANIASTPVVVDSSITVTDSDNSTLASATVSITGNFQNGADVLAFTNNPATMGNISAVYTAGTGVLALTSAGATATLAQWEAALRSVTYTNSSDAPSTSNRTISFVTNDGTASSTATTKTVSVTSANDVPVDTTSGGSTAFTEGNNTASTPVAVDNAVTVTDGDHATLASATVAITGNLQTAEDLLTFTNNPGTMGNISAVYVAGTGVMTLTSAGATATLAQWQAALRSVTYTNSSDTPNTSNRTVSFTTNDGTANGNTATKTVTVSSTNDSAVATASGGTTAFTEGANVASTPVVVDSGVTLSDVDSATLASATVSITGNLQTAEDLLAFTNNPATMGNISAVYIAGTGVMTLTSAGATATLAQWQAALRSVTYTNSSDNPNTGNRTIGFVANDGSSNSTATTKTLSVAAANDTPVDTASGGSTAFTQGNPASTPVAVDSGFTVTDPDNATLASATVAITGNFQNGEDELAFTNNPGTMGNISASYNAATGVLTLTSAGATATTAQWQAALRSVTYTDTAGTVNTSNRTISFTTNDGTADGNTVTKTVTVAPFLFPPVGTTSGGTTAFTEGANVTSTPVVVDNGFTLSDVDSAALASATVSITGNFQTGEDLLAFTNNPATMGNISAVYTAGTGVLAFTSAGATATVAQWQAALRSVTYTNSSDTPNTGNRTISFSANDGNSSGTASTKVVSVTSANDVPVDTASGGSTAFASGNNAASAPVAVDSGFTVTDPDNATLASATVAITGNFQNGEDELAFTNNPGTMGNISASYNAATGVLTLTSAGATATTAQWQAALRSVTYTDTAVTPNTSNRTISLTTNDGTANGNTATKTVTVTATSQSPMATASGGTTAFTEGANVTSTPVVVDSGITLSDLDSSTFAGATMSITGNFQTGQDLLAFTNNPATMGNISAVYAAGTGVLTLTSAGATATLAQWQAALRSVTYTNSSDTPNTGNRTISVQVNDGVGDSNLVTKPVSVAATNDAPVNTIPAAQTMLTGATHVFSTAGGNLISIGDADAGASPVKVTLTATQGLLTLSGIAGLAFTTGDGTGDASMVFTGTVADINTALNGMAFAPTAGFAGAASIQIVSDDQGSAGGGGVKTDTDTVTVTVNAPDPGGVTPPTGTPIDGVPVTTEPGPGGSTIITIPVVVPNRPDTPGTPSPTLADIPLVTSPSGTPIVSVGVPTGVGLQAEGLTTTTTGSAALAELGFRIERIAGDSPELTNAGQVFYATLGPNEPLSVQIIKPTAGAGFNPNVPLVITGSSNPADGKQAVIVDARSLPSGTVIQVDDVEFLAVVGAVRIIGGAGQNAASGDSANQWVVLGPDDDTIHGGGGNDVVGSEAGDDQVFGDAGDDIVFGGAGNDLLSGGTGSDRLNGGTGFDVAIQEGQKTDYTVTLEGAGIKLTHTASGVSDWLVDVEQVRFATGPSLTVAHSAAEEAGAYLFQKWLGRDLNQGEGAIIQTLTGKTALEVATLFAQVFPEQSAGKTPTQLLEGMAAAGAIRVDAVRDITVTGDAGNNTITPTLGLARYVDGGAGIDTVVIPATLGQTYVQSQNNGSFTLQRLTDGAMLDVTRVERVTFNDTKLALDLNGHAGEAAKLLGALGGPALLTNKGVVGEVIRLLDAGASSLTIAGLGLQLLGANTPTQIAQTLWTNVVGRAGTDGELKLLTDIMAGGVSASDLVVMAANLELNAVRIDLVGLTAKGIEFA